MLDRREARSIGEALIWYHFVARASEEGGLWYHSFRSTGAEAIAYQLDVAVDLLRKFRLEDGGNLLERCKRERDEVLGAIDEPTAAILEEGIQGAEAYLFYLQGRYQEAWIGMSNAEAAVRQALEKAPFLLSFTQKCKQLCLNKARIARNERRWDEMFRLIDLAKAMVAGRSPLCTLERGPIYADEVYDWLQGIRPADSIEEKALKSLSDRERNRVAFDHIALEASMIPNIAINAF